MKVNYIALAVVIGTFAVTIACVIVDHSIAGSIFALIGAIGAAQAPQLISRVLAAQAPL